MDVFERRPPMQSTPVSSSREGRPISPIKSFSPEDMLRTLNSLRADRDSMRLYIAELEGKIRNLETQQQQQPVRRSMGSSRCRSPSPNMTLHSVPFRSSSPYTLRLGGSPFYHKEAAMSARRSATPKPLLHDSSRRCRSAGAGPVRPTQKPEMLHKRFTRTVNRSSTLSESKERFTTRVTGFAKHSPPGPEHFGRARGYYSPAPRNINIIA